MKRVSVKVVILGCLLALAALLSGCNTPTVEEGTPTRQATVEPPAVIEAGVLTVGVDYNNAPFSSREEQGVVGIDVDTAAAIADQLGLKLKLVDANEESAGSQIANGELDMVMGVPADATADPNVVVVGRYLSNGSGLFTATTNGEPIVATAQDVMSGTVAGSQNSVASQTLEDEFMGLSVQPYPSLDEAFNAMESGEAKYLVSDIYAGAYMAARAENISFAGALGVPKAQGIAISADNADLQSSVQAALDSISSNGVLALIKSKWVGKLPTINTDVIVQPAGETDPIEVEVPEGEEVTQVVTEDETESPEGEESQPEDPEDSEDPGDPEDQENPEEDSQENRSNQ